MSQGVRLMSSKEKEKVLKTMEAEGLNQSSLPYGTIWVYIEDHFIVGTVALTEARRICCLGVTPKYRRRGFGKKLIQTAIEAGGNNLRVKLNNYGAIRMYLKMGFLPTGIRGRSLKMRRIVDEIRDVIPDVSRLLSFNPIREKFLFVKWKITNLFHRRNGTFVLDRLYIAKPSDTNLITVDALEEVYRMLKKDSPNSAKFMDYAGLFNYDDCDGDWYKWMTNRGTWPKRFATAVRKDSKEELPPAVLAKIGATLKRHLDSQETFFSFSDKPNWKAGDFGDDGSCWFSYESRSRDGLFMSKKGYAVKFYKDAESYQKHPNKGIARCWMYQGDDGTIYLFNTKGALSAEHSARSVAYVLGKRYQRCNLRATHAAYVDGNTGFAIGDNEIPDKATLQFMQEAYGRDA